VQQISDKNGTATPEVDPHKSGESVGNSHGPANTEPTKLRQHAEFSRQQQQPRDQQADSRHNQLQRKYPANPCHEKLIPMKSILRNLFRQLAADHKPGNDKDTIDSDETAWHPGIAMVQHDCQHRKCPQPIDIGPVTYMNWPANRFN